MVGRIISYLPKVVYILILKRGNMLFYITKGALQIRLSQGFWVGEIVLDRLDSSNVITALIRQIQEGQSQRRSDKEAEVWVIGGGDEPRMWPVEVGGRGRGDKEGKSPPGPPEWAQPGQHLF